MTTLFTRFRHAVSVLAAEDRPNFKRVDASRASYDDGSWLDVPAVQSTLVRRVYA